MRRSLLSVLLVAVAVIPARASAGFVEELWGMIGQMMAEDIPADDRGVTVYDRSRADDGYTLLSSLGEHYDEATGTFNGAILIDMEGNLVREWPIMGFPAKMLPGGYVIGAVGNREGHQENNALVQLDWDGNEVWRFDRWQTDDDGNPTARVHHDFQREGNPVGYYAPSQTPLVHGGKTLLLSHDNVVRPDIAPWELEDDVLYEVDWDGNILWTWHAVDHFYEMGFTPEALQAIASFRVSAGSDIGGGAEIHDYLHLNTASVLGPNRWFDGGDQRFAPDNVMISSRNANLIAIVERTTGDIVWRIGPNYAPGNPEHDLQPIIGQHMPHLIPKELPGDGNLLVFDNGGFAGYGRLRELPFSMMPILFPSEQRDYSRVLEINPVTLEVVWKYERYAPAEGESYRFFSWYISSAQRLKNGNTLITEGAKGRIFEVTRRGELVWEYISPYSDLSDMAGLGFGNDVYRAYRVPKSWVQRD